MQVHEKFRVVGWKLYFGFMDLEQVFDIVVWEIIRWAMLKLGEEKGG